MQLFGGSSSDIQAQEVYKEDIAITSRDFKFVHFSNPDQFFDGAPRPFRLIQVPPSLEMYTKVIYTPSTRDWRPFDGCLYDQELNRIEASILRRTREDTVLSSEPSKYSGSLAELPTYDRPVLYLGYINRHFGHFLLESLSHWWGLAEDLGVDRYLIHVQNPDVLKRPYVKNCLDALGLDEGNLVFFNQPTIIQNAIVPEASFQLYSSVHTKYRTIMHKLAVALGAEESLTTEQPIYVSRRLLSKGKSQYHGEEHLESYFAKRGALIVHPQQMPISDQVRLFNKHRNVFGITGSGMHNIVFSLEPSTITYFSNNMPNSNCFLVDKGFNAHSTYVNVCQRIEVHLSVLNRVKKKLTGTGRKGKRTEGFLASFNVDYEKAIAWIEKSGAL